MFPSFRIHCRNLSLEVSPEHPAVMGILNTTPDSFSGDPRSLEEIICRMIQEKPDIIDIGGESTRPGAEDVSVEEELARVLPALQIVLERMPQAIISIDTRKSEVAAAALKAGAHIINDVSSLQYDPDIARVTADYGAALILNHSRGTPQTMNRPEFLQYPDGVCKTVAQELKRFADQALKAGIKKDSLILDPGLGFAKNTEQNIDLLKNVSDLLDFGYPLLSGPSRKRFIGELTGESVPLDRDYGTCGAVAASILAGYSIVRVHNVKAAKDCLRVFCPVLRS